MREGVAPKRCCCGTDALLYEHVQWVIALRQVSVAAAGLQKGTPHGTVVAYEHSQLARRSGYLLSNLNLFVVPDTCHKENFRTRIPAILGNNQVFFHVLQTCPICPAAS